MSLEVNYGPIGLAGVLAVRAGQNESAYKAQEMALEQQRLNMEQQAQFQRQQAQDKAFELQQAQASQIAVAQRRTPAAESVAGALAASNMTKQDQQQQSLAQLDDMLSKGQITPTQYQNARAGVMTGSKGLIDKAIMPPDQGDPMQKPIFQAQLRSIREQREAAYDELKQINAAKLDPFKSGQVPAGRDKVLQAQIDQTYADEQKILAQATPKPAEAAQPSGNIAGYNPASPTQSSPSAWVGPTAPLGAEGIQNLSRSMAGPGAAPINQTVLAPNGTPDTYAEGHILTNRRTGVSLVKRQGQWVPNSDSTIPATPPDTSQAPPTNFSVSGGGPGSFYKLTPGQ
jgi:hypothetical protein